MQPKALFRLSSECESLDCVVTAMFLTSLVHESFQTFGSESIIQIMNALGNMFLKPLPKDQGSEVYDLYVVDYEDESLLEFLPTIPPTSFCVDYRMLGDDNLYADLLRLLCLDPEALVTGSTLTVSDFTKEYKQYLRSFVDFTTEHWPLVKQAEENRKRIAEPSNRPRVFMQHGIFAAHPLDVAKSGISPYLSAWYKELNSATYGE